MQESQRGIALVEAALALVLLGIVVVTAVGQFDDMSHGTAAAVHKNVDVRISSAAAINYTARILDPSSAVTPQSTDACAGDRQVAAFPSDFDSADYGVDEAGFNCR
jgi:Tfp pilus assembly protein PilX